MQDNILESWDAFDGEYLKVNNITSEEDAFVVTNVGTSGKENDIKPLLYLERLGLKKKLILNQPNIQFIKNEGFNSPKQLIGCMIYFRIIKTQNPVTNKEVNGIRIDNIEKIEDDGLPDY